MIRGGCEFLERLAQGWGCYGWAPKSLVCPKAQRDPGRLATRRRCAGSSHLYCLVSLGRGRSNATLDFLYTTMSISWQQGLVARKPYKKNVAFHNNVSTQRFLEQSRLACSNNSYKLSPPPSPAHVPLLAGLFVAPRRALAHGQPMRRDKAGPAEVRWREAQGDAALWSQGAGVGLPEHVQRKEQRGVRAA